MKLPFTVMIQRPRSCTKTVKHFFWTADNTVLTLAILPDPNSSDHYYVQWLREKLCWYKVKIMKNNSFPKTAEPT